MVDFKKITNELKLKITDTQEYIKFLDFTSRGNINRYSPENQLLIYAQKPDAELLVPFDSWKKVSRYPMSGTGIHIYPTETFKVNASCVFDIKDTKGKEFDGFVKVEPSEYDYIQSLFAEKKENLEKSIENLTRTYVCVNMRLGGIGFLTKEEVEDAVADLSAYVIKRHCGLESYVKDETINLLNQLNEYTQFKIFFDYIQPNIHDISRTVTRMIDVSIYKHREEIKAYGKDIERDNEGKEHDRRADNRTDGYDDGRRENEISGRTGSENANERGRDNRTYRLDGESSDELHQGEVSTALLSNDDRRRDASIRDEESGRSEGDAGRLDGEGTQEEGNRERDGLHGVSETEEGSRHDGKRSSTDRDITTSDGDSNLLNESNDESAETYTIDGIEMAIEVEPLREIDDELKDIFTSDEKMEMPEEYFEQALIRGTGFENGKYRVLDILGTYSEQEAALLVKKEYGIGGTSGYTDEGVCGYSTFGKNYTVEWKDSSGETHKNEFKWINVVRKIKELIFNDKYLSSEEKLEYLKEYKSVHKKSSDVSDELLTELVMSLGAYNKHDIANSIKNKSREEQLDDISKYYGIAASKTFDSEIFGHVGFDNNNQNGIFIQWTENGVEHTANKSFAAIHKKVEELVLENKFLTEEDIEKWNEFERQSHKSEEQPSVAVEETESLDTVIDTVQEIKDDDKTYSVYDSNDEKTTLVARDGSGVIRVPNEKIKNGKILSGEPISFHYDDNWEPTTGSDKQRYKANVEAIKLLKQIENEGRYATKEEQEVLSHYVGWGGLSSVFDENNTTFKEEYQELKELLTISEYEAARSSVTDSFYTPKEVMEGVYDALKRMGFTGGNILEPSCGIGNFFNAMPEDLAKNTNCYGVELDSISGRIANILHPEAKIKVMGYEKTDLEDNFYDVVIGNVPFGNFKVYDPKYASKNFLIHDYFFAKSLDKVAPGGLVCLITSKGTLDKQNPKIRKYLAERADLVGAIRLPNNTFKSSANTEATSDIIILKKKEKPIICEPDWVHLGFDDRDIAMNRYFIDNPEMLLGTMEKDTSRYGEDRAITYLAPKENESLKESLEKAVSLLPENIISSKSNDLINTDDMENDDVISATPDVKNHTFTIIDGEIYLRENAYLHKYKLKNQKQGERIKGLCELRDLLHEILDAQVHDCSDEELAQLQDKLNTAYDKFVKKNGFVSERANASAFEDDVEYAFVTALERPVENTYVKTNIFTQRTVKPNIKKDKADSGVDALYMVLNECGHVDIEKILNLYPVSFEELKKELQGLIFCDPARKIEDEPYSGWVTADEYLSGNVRNKLSVAETYAKESEEYLYNVEKLKEVQPKDLEANEISVRIGTTWIDLADYENFLKEKLDIKGSYADRVKVEFVKMSNSYSITNKNTNVFWSARTNLEEKYGTSRMNALEIFETLLNMREVTVRDRVEDGDKVKYVINQRETILAREKATILKNEFSNWIFNDIERREKYVKYYNETFNSEVNRTYDGFYMEYPGMNSNITLKPHQKNMVCRAVMGGNSLAAHCVGAGKTYEMATITQEWKRLGLANKPMIVTPNHLVGQFAAEYLDLYPNANLLVATTKDFEKKNRRKFISKIATGDYDCVIIGHSQFEKIGLSQERQIRYLEEEKDEIMAGIAELKDKQGQNWSIKQMETQRKKLDEQLEKLKNAEYKEEFINFEELGVDGLLLDEAHEYKNLTFTTKMSNVAGINPNGSKKATDMFMKIQYIQELTPGRNVVFATGTPISNSMAEMYTMQKYLQPEKLKELGIYHFDSWAANFGEIETAMELAPEGENYREKTRFAKFVNLPELIKLYREVADVQMADMLDLDTPELKNGDFTVVECEPNETQLYLMKEIQERAKAIRDKKVDSSIDNMLKICHDGKLLATDIRMIDPNAENFDDSKLNVCVDNVVSKYNEYEDDKGIQIIFSDIGTPGGSSEGFGVYTYLKERLIEKGIPEDEICFIHDAKTTKAREDMFADLRNGKKRVIIGSTAKMGTGTNIQKRLCAMHEIDCPWRPSDVEQREGRILRQGNMFPEVEIFRYVTKKTFDAYNWSIIVRKQKFISQVMTSKDVARSCEDIDESVMSYEQVMAAATDNPYIKEKIEVDAQIQKLMMLKNSFEQNKWKLESKVKREYPTTIAATEKLIEKLEADKKRKDLNPFFSTAKKEVDEAGMFKESTESAFSIEIGGRTFDNRSEANEFILAQKSGMNVGDTKIIGSFCGFEIGIKKEYLFGEVQYSILVRGEHDYSNYLGQDSVTRAINLIKDIDKKLELAKEKLEGTQKDFELAKEELEKNFDGDEKLQQLTVRQAELTDLLAAKDEEESKEESQEQELSGQKNQKTF